MIVPNELLESALDSLPEGIALLDKDGAVAFWNRAAQAITGHTSVDLLAQPVPEALETLLRSERNGYPENEETAPSVRGALVQTQHKLGHRVQAMTHAFALRDGLGGRIGTAVLFRPAESLDGLPVGDAGGDSSIEACQADIEDRLAAVHEDFAQGGMPFGVFWIAVDQARELRDTHGVMACEAMLDKVERAMVNGLRPGEAMGRWGQFELLAVSHERTPEMLAEHGHLLVGLARTADFRWWGDRISLTVSIGAAQSAGGETLKQLLGRAREAMASSMDAGGNHIALAPEGPACLPS
jgi:PAS domain S-box-containing protein